MILAKFKKYFSVKSVAEEHPDMGSQERTLKMKKNIFISFGVRFLGIFINFLFVPLTIKFINSEKYGIWLTVSSIVSWFSLLDIGFSNGLRNRYASAGNNQEEQRRLVHTTLSVLCLISVSILTVYFVFFRNSPWDRWLGVSTGLRKELQNLFSLIIVLFAVQFVLQIITPIQYALQRPSLVSATILVGNIFGLVGILFLRAYARPSLVSLGLVVTGGNVLSYLIFFSYYFFYERKDLFKNFSKPTLIDFNSVFSLGIKFFVVNIAYVVQYQTSNILISRYFSPEKVSEFNIAYKLLSISTIVFGIIVSPIWSSVTNAKVNNDFLWIQKTVKRLIIIWSLLTFGSIIILLLSPYIYHFWIGNSVQIPILVSIGVAGVVSVNSFSAIFIQTLNGLSVVNLQFWLSIFVIIFFIPLAFFLAVTLNFGVFGICIATIISNVNGIIIAPIQLKRFLNKMRSMTKEKLAVL